MRVRLDKVRGLSRTHVVAADGDEVALLKLCRWGCAANLCSSPLEA